MRPCAVGSTLAAGVVGTYLVALGSGWPTEQARALAFATLLAAQPFLVLGARRPDSAWWRSPLAPTRVLVAALAAVVAAAVAEVPAVATVARLEPFPRWGWIVVVVVAATTTLWVELTKRRHPR
ncbi:MAG: cation transporting ATPase C-terminal domain-containing protein [Acidimicrobiales bacterium]